MCAKKKVERVQTSIEPDLVYPLLRGRDVQAMAGQTRQLYIILAQDPTDTLHRHS